MSFRARILAALTLILAVNAAVIAFVTIDQARRAFRRDSEARLGVTARAVANEMDARGRSLVLRTRDLATRPDVLDLLEAAATGAIARDDPRLVSLAPRIMGTEIDRLVVLASDGTVLSSAPDVARFGTASPRLAATAVTDAPTFLIEHDGNPYLGAAAPTPTGERVIALLASGDDLARKLAGGAGTEVSLRLGRSIFTSAPDAEGLSELALPAGTVRHLSLGSVIGADLEMWEGEVRLLRRSDVLDSLRRDLVRTVPIVVGLSLLLLWPLALFLARGLGRPVEALTQATERVAAGEWDRAIDDPGGPREFKTLIASFNEMQTELLRQRDELRRAERAGAWRDAARRMAHEIKNALTPIQIAWERVRRGGGDELSGHAENVEQEIASLRQLLTAFRDLAEWPEPQTRETNVSELVTATVDLYAPTTSATISVDAPTPVRAAIDPGQVSRAVSNLLQNAIEAVGEGGTITIEVREKADHAVVVVVDDGPGLDESGQADVFMPYYTTKSTGTGLGLAIVERVADAHGGTAHFESAPGAGTRVTLTLKRER